MKVFGYVYYVYINNHGRNKLDKKITKMHFHWLVIVLMILVIYFGMTKKKKKVIRNRDAIFNEKILYKNMDTTQSTN